jgi:hypothetical protein
VFKNQKSLKVKYAPLSYSPQYFYLHKFSSTKNFLMAWDGGVRQSYEVRRSENAMPNFNYHLPEEQILYHQTISIEKSNPNVISYLMPSTQKLN